MNLILENMKVKMNHKIILTVVGVGLAMLGYSKEIPGFGQKMSGASLSNTQKLRQHVQFLLAQLSWI